MLLRFVAELVASLPASSWFGLLPAQRKPPKVGVKTGDSPACEYYSSISVRPQRTDGERRAAGDPTRVLRACS